MALVLLLVWVPVVLAAWQASRFCDDHLALNPVWRTVPAKFQRVGVSENAVEPDRPSGSGEPLPAKTQKVRIGVEKAIDLVSLC